MTLHPRSLPRTAPPKACEIPGLAYYSAPPVPPTAHLSPPAQSKAAEVLEAMYGYYSPQDCSANAGAKVGQPTGRTHRANLDSCPPRAHIRLELSEIPQMFIQTESTPNPATLKFLPGQTVLEMGTADFPSAETAGKSPLATRIFAVAGVTGVFFGTDFVTVTKAEAVDWGHIKPAILGAIMEHYQSGALVIEGEQAAAHQAHDGPDGDIVRQIKELLDTRVRPAVAQDGGDITFHGFDRGIVYLHMKGACAGCPSSTLTLKMGIENLLRHYIPEVTEVRPVAA